METPPTKNSLMKRYELEVDGQLAILEYQERDPSTLVFIRTFVPTALRGQNIAALLTRFALEDARRQGKQVIPQCSYTGIFMQRNKEFEDLRGQEKP